MDVMLPYELFPGGGGGGAFAFCPPRPSPVCTTPAATLRAPFIFTERVDADGDGDGAAPKNSKTCATPAYDYDGDITASLLAMEKDEEHPSPTYLKDVQTDRMTPTTRADLVRWIDAAARHFSLSPGTFHRAVSFVDRALSACCLQGYSENSLHLLGSAALFVAAKYEETRSERGLAAADVAFYGGLQSRQAVLEMENDMLLVLDYRLSGPTAYTFVERFAVPMLSHGDVGCERGMRVRCLAHKLALRSLRNYGCLAFLPSIVAASAIFLARSALRLPPWSAQMQELTGYSAHDLLGCINTIDSQP